MIAEVTEETATDPLSHTPHTHITPTPTPKPSVSSTPSTLRFINHVPTRHHMEYHMTMPHPPTS